MAAWVGRVLALGSLLATMSCHRVTYDLEQWRESCTDYCDTTFECFDEHPNGAGVPSDIEACRRHCAEDTPRSAPNCLEEHSVYFDCLSEMSCSEMATFYDEPTVSELDDSLCSLEYWTYSLCEPE